ncbi:uncharacterized protein BDW70DRAFT_158562 [Aspergillus foveolatus]|uniref:uncharacterized protein n=1 Tax=Aspergillus foveolatus TaxID=210207 RepID=UPI003CCD1413
MQKPTFSVAGAVQDPATDDTRNLPSKIQLTSIIVSLCLAVICQALDTTIIATAIPRIADEFDSLGDVGWYGAAYLLTDCASLLSYGRLYNLLPGQWVFLGELAVFELGSLICGAMPSSVGLVLGRVFQGIDAGVSLFRNAKYRRDCVAETVANVPGHARGHNEQIPEKIRTISRKSSTRSSIIFLIQTVLVFKQDKE